MDNTWRTALWQQFGASIDMLEQAVLACPDELWGDRSQRPEYWYVTFHTLFFLDLYLTGSAEGFAPPAPFTLDEMDPRGILPDRVYTRDELLTYLEHGRKKCRETIANLTDEQAGRRCSFPWGEVSFVELLLDNMRHVQHHAAQLYLILRQQTDSAPRWVSSTKRKLGDE
ncbi:MAG TPA: DinB family protein [Symbiobacteriaceae bacterium]|nr:DinB family protein [Symbiobacteriaceae bacterium]